MEKMTKNLFPEIAHRLGVGLEEEFTIETCIEATFKFTSDGLMERFDYDGVQWINSSLMLCRLLKGDLGIIKFPWKPRIGEYYWTFDLSNTSTSELIKWTIGHFQWENSPLDVCAFKNGWVFRTAEDAESALPAVAEEMGVKF